MLKRTIFTSALLSFIYTSQLLAIEVSSLGVFVKKRQDIDYHLDTLGTSVSFISSYGLFRCDPAILKGITRIDSFNNIFGIADVRKAEWNSFSARDIECRYGAKWDVADGILKAGIGIRDYRGETVDKPGGKDISIKGGGALLDYDSEDFDAKLKWKREIHDYTLRNKTSVGNYDSLVDATEDIYTASATYKRLYLHTQHVRGNKDNVYTTPLFPPNRFRYAFTDVALGLGFDPGRNGLTLIAPIIGEGSYRGSFNPLESDSGLKGIKLAGRINGFEVDLNFVQHKGEGSRPYLPATEKLTENKDTTTVSLGIQGDDWYARLENARSTHTGHAAIADPIYAAIVGGFGPFTNRRAEDKWTLSISLPIRKNIKADISLYYTDRQDRQYSHPEHEYTEAGGLIRLTFSE